MKKLLMIVMVVLFTGCATDGIYNVGKTIYIGGKAVVIQNADLLDEKTLETLKNADNYASRYDTARGVVKKSLDGNVTTPTKVVQSTK